MVSPVGQLVSFMAPHPALTSIFFACFCASAFLGSVTVSTPFLKLASILSGSTLSGSSKLRLVLVPKFVFSRSPDAQFDTCDAIYAGTKQCTAMLIERVGL
jgi:hypothetical protein